MFTPARGEEPLWPKTFSDTPLESKNDIIYIFHTYSY